MLSGTLDDYELMTEGEHSGRYGARINGEPYVVMAHVDVFLLRLQKGTQVDVTLSKEGQISKIAKAKKALPQKADDGFTTAQKLQKAGFNQSATSPRPATETMSESEAEILKARGEQAAKEKAHAEEMVRISKEAAQKAMKDLLAHDEEILRAAQGNNTDCTSPKTPEAKPDMEGINRRAKECQAQMRAENDARKRIQEKIDSPCICLLYTSDAADE